MGREEGICCKGVRTEEVCRNVGRRERQEREAVNELRWSMEVVWKSDGV